MNSATRGRERPIARRRLHRQSGLSAVSIFFLIFQLVWALGLILMTKGLVVPAWLRWGVTIVWLVATLILGIIDFQKTEDTSRDATPFDRWTFIHTGAGVVFGLWYVPLFYLLLVIVIWEVFEFAVAGFGDQEVILNRVVDVGVALVGWLAVVLVVMAIARAPFPLATPYKSGAATAEVSGAFAALRPMQDDEGVRHATASLQ
jgi:hypothetical protein